jgi:hypothetical protein
MEFGVLHLELEEKEVKPSELLKEYRQKVSAEIPKLLQTEVKTIVCPFCGSKSEKRKSKQQHGLELVECAQCASFYAPKRPNQTTLNHYFLSSEARTFWNAEFLKRTYSKRKEKIFGPIADWVHVHLLENFGTTKEKAGIELYPVHQGFSESLKEVAKEVDLFFCDPLFLTKAPSLKRESMIPLDFALLFDVVPKVENPVNELKFVHEALRPGGLCFMTLLLSSGLDLMTLGPDSDQLIPPDHLNVPSFEAIQSIVQKQGFEILEMSTPGQLDIQHLASQYKNNPQSVPAFFQYLFEKRNRSLVLEEMQMLIQEFQLSSQGRIVLKKKEVR